MPQAVRSPPPLPTIPFCFESFSDFARRQKRSEEHTSELQSRLHLVCRLLLEKKKNVHSCHENSSWRFHYVSISTVHAVVVLDLVDVASLGMLRTRLRSSVVFPGSTRARSSCVYSHHHPRHTCAVRPSFQP